LLSTLIIMITIGLLVIAYLVLQPAYLGRKRKKISNTEFPQKWKNTLNNKWPLYRRLPDLLKQNLHNRIKIFMVEKQFIGANGFEVFEEHRLLIAAQACLLIVNKPFEYFDKLQIIMIYPSTFVASRERMQSDGTIINESSVNSGEAWETGKIILSWDATYAGLINISDGQNVVIHEFAHLLDNTNGSANGAPLLEHANNYQQWSRIFSAAYDRLQHSVERGHKTTFNPYGTVNPGEFFAVASELFFEKSSLFQKEEPLLYQQLEKFYAVDPALW